MKRFRNRTNTSRQLGRGFGQRARNLRQSLFRHRRNCLGHYWQKLAGGHSNQREEVFGSLVLGLRFGC